MSSDLTSQKLHCRKTTQVRKVDSTLHVGADTIFAESGKDKVNIVITLAEVCDLRRKLGIILEETENVVLARIVELVGSDGKKDNSINVNQ